MFRCPYCGKEISYDSSWCPYCGSDKCIEGSAESHKAADAEASVSPRHHRWWVILVSSFGILCAVAGGIALALYLFA